MKFVSYAIVCVLAMQAGTAAAQEFPKRIDQPVLDPYGVEIKSGRFGDLTIPLIAIGGGGDYSLQRIYAPQDGREMLVRAIYDEHTSQQIFNRLYGYDVIRYQTPNGTVKFRRPAGSSASFVADYPARGNLAGGVFTDKYGVTYENGKVTYPDGREIWGGTTSIGVDPSFHALAIMRNNFGFLLKTTGGVTQAVNLAHNYCDFNAAASCAGLSATRTASVIGTGTQHYALTNAAGEVVDVQLQPIEAYDGEPSCYQNPNTPYTCNGTRYAYNYPTTITFPGSSKSQISISYRGSGDPRNVSHGEVVVQNVTRNGVTVTYDNSLYLYGAGGTAPTGYQTYIKAYVNGAQLFYANSTNIGRQWPPSELNLKTVQDGLNRYRTFSYDNNDNLAEYIQSEGNSIVYEYDERFNLKRVTNYPKSGSGNAKIVTNYEYPASCSVPTQTTCNLATAMIDPTGNRTEYTYNAYGQVLTKTSPAPKLGEARPIVRNTYTMRTAFILDASGNAVPAGSPISMLTMTSTCLKTENCVGTTDEVVTRYDYGLVTGLNNLLLRGISITAMNGSGQLETLRTCYGYNYFGERISETKSRAGLTKCP